MPLDAQQFAREVSQAIYILRGYRPSSVPPEVRDDVFKVMTADPYYSTMLAQDIAPGVAANAIQNRVWDHEV